MTVRSLTVEEWIVALRGGEWQQCRGSLYNGTGYCCLGVALSEAGGEFTPNERRLYSCQSDIGVLDATIPALGEVGEWLSQDRFLPNSGWEGGSGNIPTQQYVLTEMNDEGWTFEEIASYIEASYYRSH